MPTKTALAPDGTLGARPRIAAHRSGWRSAETPTHADAAHRVGDQSRECNAGRPRADAKRGPGSLRCACLRAAPPASSPDRRIERLEVGNGRTRRAFDPEGRRIVASAAS